MARGSDRTVRAVHAQLAAMGCAEYEIGILDAQRGRMIPRHWTREEVQRAISWLQHMNSQGHDIYVRPAGSVGLVLVDDLTAPALTQMKRDGIPPAVVVESSPGSFHAWVRLSPTPIASEDATAAAKALARRYGGDPNSADWRHYGRLAGFTNRKGRHRRPDGQQPYVLLHEVTGASAQNALQSLLQTAKVQMVTEGAIAAPERLQRAVRGPGETPGEHYEQLARVISRRYANPDMSRVDWWVCRRILREMAARDVEVDEAYLERALLDGSPDLETRKAGHVQDYVRRTAQKAVREWRAQREL